MNEPKPTVHVAGAVIIQNRKLLATQRGHGDYAGWWEFPGGKIKEGETPEAALVREIKEELDAEIDIDRYLATTEYEYPKSHISMRCYLCALAPNSEIQLLEHSSALWLDRTEIHSVKWLGADLPILDELILQKII